uniref:Uncharacterized protein n=1 Tax=Strongyloides stercoralis TaxID=6248 RepID=A0AAF5DQQ2_STRER
MAWLYDAELIAVDIEFLPDICRWLIMSMSKGVLIFNAKKISVKKDCWKKLINFFLILHTQYYFLIIKMIIKNSLKESLFKHVLKNNPAVDINKILLKIMRPFFIDMIKYAVIDVFILILIYRKIKQIIINNEIFAKLEDVNKDVLLNKALIINGSISKNFKTKKKDKGIEIQIWFFEKCKHYNFISWEVKDKILFIFDELKVRFDEKHIPKNVLIVKSITIIHVITMIFLKIQKIIKKIHKINKENLQKDLLAENEIGFYNVDGEMCYSNGFVIDIVGGKMYHNKNKMFFSKFTLLKMILCFIVIVAHSQFVIRLNLYNSIKLVDFFWNQRIGTAGKTRTTGRTWPSSTLRRQPTLILNKVVCFKRKKLSFLNSNLKRLINSSYFKINFVEIYGNTIYLSKMLVDLSFGNNISYDISRIRNLTKLLLDSNTTRKLDIEKYSPAPIYINDDAPFDNCLDESIEDEDSYSSTEYDGIARIGINIVLSVSNNSSNNKITSLDFGSVSNVIKNELMNNSDEHGSDSNSNKEDDFKVSCKEFFLTKIFQFEIGKYMFLKMFKNLCYNKEKIVALLIDSMYSKNNVTMLANIVYVCELICINPEKYSTEISKILEKLDNYSNYKPEYITYYFLKFKRLLEYITTEDSNLSPLFKGYNYKVQIDKSSLENLYFISEANIDLHEINVMFEKENLNNKEIFDLRKTIIFLLDCISNLLNTFIDCRFSFKYNEIVQKKYRLIVKFQYILSNVINIPNKKKNLTKCYCESIPFGKINDYITTFNINVLIKCFHTFLEFS